MAAPYSERECEGTWEKTSSGPYKKGVKKKKKAVLNERAAAKKAGVKETGEREGEEGQAVFNRAL